MIHICISLTVKKSFVQGFLENPKCQYIRRNLSNISCFTLENVCCLVTERDDGVDDGVPAQLIIVLLRRPCRRVDPAHGRRSAQDMEVKDKGVPIFITL